MTDDDPASASNPGSPGSERGAPGDKPDPGQDAPTFDAPWQARAFSLAVALTDEEDRPWREFQSRLVEELDAADEASDDRNDTADPEEVYYRQWLAALERLLVEEDLLDSGELAARVESFEAGDRTAHEFVAGDPHAHANRLPESHAEGSGHDHGDHDHPH